MNCENCFCVYEAKGKCTLEEVSIDRAGMCMDCIYPDIDEEVLEQAKLKLLNRWEETEIDSAIG